ncbi:hypothetical protein C8R47DRAFT_214720 [Mycena vitilis]|nr:hypothetical protein C8R47DRAFT_214720 [Mycena vitilis]
MSASAPGLDIPLLTGPIILGYMWNYWLYGILCIQVYLYSEAFPNDRRGIKVVMWVMFILESISTLFVTIGAWDQYGTGWGDINSLLVIDWSWIPLAILNPVLAGIAQSFYIWRIWELSKRVWLCVIIGLIMLTQVTTGCYYGIVLAIERRGLDKLLALSTEIALAAIASAVTDILITISLVWTLTIPPKFYGLKHKTRIQNTRGIINKLIRFSVETGAVTTTADTIHVVLWLATGHQWNIHYIFWLMLGKLYSNMLMATLNCRAPTVSRGTETGTTSIFWVEVKPPGASRSSRTEVHISLTRDVSGRVEAIEMEDSTIAGNSRGGVPFEDKSVCEDKSAPVEV